MSEPFTPGPWTVPHFVDNPSATKPCQCGYVFTQSCDTTIATVHHSKEPHDDDFPSLQVATANARLIASAPDMHALLQKILTSRAIKDNSEDIEQSVTDLLKVIRG